VCLNCNQFKEECSPGLTLTLLMAGVLADNANNPIALEDLAVSADLLN